MRKGEPVLARPFFLLAAYLAIGLRGNFSSRIAAL